MSDPPTPQTQSHPFATHYAGLRDGLPLAERVVLDEAYRDGLDRLATLRLRPGADAERPMFLAMLVAEKRRVRDLQKEVRLLRQATQQLTLAVEGRQVQALQAAPPEARRHR